MRGTHMLAKVGVVVPAALSMLSACAETGRGSSAGPALLDGDSVVLAESDTLYLGRPGDFAIDPRDGTFYVSDAFSGRVVRFDRRGSAVASYGSKGDGPGEFRDAGEVV